VGYAGGTTNNPSYRNIGDYSETVRVEYDPAVVSYEQLLAAFWSSHKPVSPVYSSQYRSAIFYTNEQQRALANESKQAEESRLGMTVYTDIEPYTGFYAAEDYHQKYYLRQRTDIVDTLYAIYPDPGDFRDSTAAARLNGYVTGFGDLDALKKNLDSFGLSEAGKEALLQITKSGLRPVCPVTVGPEQTD
jgi:peptide-methionine (S)-S-oxide reductase